MLVRPLGVGETVFERMLRGQERDNPLARHIETEIGDEMPEIVFFLRADGVVGQKHEGPSTGETSDCVVGVDPGIHSLVCRERRTRRTEFGGKDRGVGPQGGEKVGSGQRSQA